MLVFNTKGSSNTYLQQYNQSGKLNLFSGNQSVSDQNLACTRQVYLEDSSIQPIMPIGKRRHTIIQQVPFVIIW